MRRSFAVLVPALLFLLSSCGEAPIPAEYLQIEITTPERTVTLGQRFEVRVRRIWSRDLEPADFTETALAPLRSRLREVVRRENDTHLEETRVYAAWAFMPGELQIPAPTLLATPRLGGADLAVKGDSLELTVRGTIDPQAPGEAELPGGPIPSRRSWWPVLLAVAAALGLAYWQRGRLRRKPAVAPPQVEPEAPPLAEDVLAELSRLQAEGRNDDGLYRELSGVVRRYVTRRFDVEANERTTEELLSSPPLIPHAARLRVVLGPCDLVKFARHTPTRAERKAAFDAAAVLVRETSAP